jgi:ornithine cyclodeaminase
MDGTYITAARTAASSALPTRLLARPDARLVAVIGTGVQANAHVRALARNPGVARITVAGRDHAKATALVDELPGAIAVAVEAVPSIEDAVRTADVVCLTTHANAPVIRREWLRPGTHVNSVGYNFDGSGEVDSGTIRDAFVVVESRDAALAPPPAGAVELLRAIDSGVISRDHLRCELGQLVANEVPGRTNDTQITLYKSVGIAAQDAAAAALVFHAARDRGIGTQITL